MTDDLVASLRTAALAAARSGDPAAADAALHAYITHASRRPRWRRTLAWYMALPHQRYVITPVLEWAYRRPAVALPIGVVALVAEVALLPSIVGR